VLRSPARSACSAAVSSQRIASSLFVRAADGFLLQTCFDLVEPRETLGAGLERARVPSAQLVQHALLAEQARVVQGLIGADEVARRLDRGEGAVVRPEALAHVSERLVHAREFSHVDVVELRRGRDRALVQLAGVDVRERRLRAVTGLDRVRPRLRVHSRLEEVEGQESR
jgi:hypothetical protein